MQIDLFSFGAGVILSLAGVIIYENLFSKLFGNRKLRELEVTVRRQKKILQKKDELIKKSLQNMQKEVEDDKKRDQ